MPEESVDEFLNKATAERKPLTDQEKREAIVVAREVWKKAMEKAGGQKGSTLFRSEDENSRKTWEDAISSSKAKDASHESTTLIINTSWPKDSAYGRRYLSTDLIINVFTAVHTLHKGKSEPTRQAVATYYFSPTQVVKESKSIVPEDRRELDEIFSIKDSNGSEWALRKYRRRLEEQSTRESYHPDKKDLQSLLSIVSSAKELPPSSAKIVPWPK